MSQRSQQRPFSHGEKDRMRGGTLDCSRVCAGAMTAPGAASGHDRD
ncbi:MAG: hypothetical protein ACLPWS_08605 [Rhodomicrobium sp.]